MTLIVRKHSRDAQVLVVHPYPLGLQPADSLVGSRDRRIGLYNGGAIARAFAGRWIP